ncbi:hypothetical protein ACIP4W_40280 [Streptomyces sp. NPDC088846]|uniref:hypothetical protein n=1 Tax=Streptomyces sp. NPDC088846 TaxID=3365908 RepID=UPI00381FDC5E
MGKLTFGFVDGKVADAPDGSETITLSGGQSMTTTDGGITNNYQTTKPADEHDD